MPPQRRPALLALLVLAAAACGGPPAPRPLPAPPPQPRPEAVPRDVWTREPGVRLAGDSATAPGTTLPYAAMRLEVIRADSARFLVRCSVCPRPATGWVARESVLSAAATPALAAAGTLAEFALAVRAAASRRDVQALRAVMSPRFVHDPDGRDGTVEALGDWQAERYRRLDRLPFLLDRGLATVEDTDVWAAPPDYATLPGYQDLRAGFRRTRAGRWEWVFYVQGKR